MPVQMLFGKKFGKLRDQAVVFTDARLKLINEILVGFMAVKMYCWENALSKLVSQNRKLEMKYIQRGAMINALNMTVYFGVRPLLAISVFFPYLYLNNNNVSLKPSTVFSVLTFFAMFKWPILYAVPVVIERLSEAQVSLRRIQEFLLIKETVAAKDSMELLQLLDDSDNIINNGDSTNDHINTTQAKIILNNATFSWDLIEPVTLTRKLTSKNKIKMNQNNEKSEQLSRLKSTSSIDVAIDKDIKDMDSYSLKEKSTRHQLCNICINITNKSFYAIVGRIGSGKSSLLSAILGELPLQQSKNDGVVSGSILQGKIAYACQKVWIFNGTVKDNILFGNEFDQEWYNKVIYSCCLIQDFETFSNYDETVIGERGINLSGGQKSRVGLARAVYSRADIYLLDDPLSAVDSVVAKHIFDNVFDNKNGILKNSIRILVTHQTQFMDRVDCVIVMENGSIVHQDSLENLQNKGVNIDSLIEQQSEKKIDKNEASGATMDDEKRQQQSRLEKKQQPMISQRSKSIIKEETSATGSVSLSAYISLFDSKNSYTSTSSNTRIQICQCIRLFGLILLIFGSQVILAGSDYWLGIWANASKQDQRTLIYPLYFIIIAMGALMIRLVGAISFFKAILNGAGSLHNRMFNGVLHAPMMFYQSNPVGRLLNRFSKDQYIVDELVKYSAQQYID